MRKHLPLITFIAALSLPLAGCSSTNSTDSTNGKVKVIASFYPLAFVAQKIGGNLVSVENLVPPGVEPHDLELTPSQVASLSKADIVFYIKGLQPAVDKAITQSTIKNVVDVSSLEELPGVSPEIVGNDPHIWNDPIKYGKVASIFAQKISQIDAQNSSAYAANLSSFLTRLEKLNNKFTDGLSRCVRNEIVTSHSAFSYMAKRYGLIQIGIAGLSPEAEPSPKRLNEIALLIKRDKITTIFFEALLSPKIAETLASDLKIKTAVLDPIEGVSKGQTYFSVMESNLAALREVLACK